ncbi:Fic family protein [Nocardia sp. NPDC003963]
MPRSRGSRPIRISNIYRRAPAGTGGFLLDGGLKYRISTPEAARAELESLCDWYNAARSRPVSDPCALAAELQQRAVSIHPWQDYNGRFSRLLMNWSLECDGLPPAALPDFDRDVFSTTPEWAEAVRTGSAAFGERANRLEQLGADADPVELFGLADDYERYRALGRSTAPFGCGDYQDIDGCRRQLDELRAEGLDR